MTTGMKNNGISRFHPPLPPPPPINEMIYMTKEMGLLGRIGLRKAILIQINEHLKNEHRPLYKENKIQMIKRSSNQ